MWTIYLNWLTCQLEEFLNRISVFLIIFFHFLTSSCLTLLFHLCWIQALSQFSLHLLVIYSLAIITRVYDIWKYEALSLTSLSCLSTKIWVDYWRLDCTTFISYIDLLHSLLMWTWATQASAQHLITEGVIITALLYFACLTLDFSLIYFYLDFLISCLKHVLGLNIDRSRHGR